MKRTIAKNAKVDKSNYEGILNSSDVTLDDLDGLPDELLQQLQITESMREDMFLKSLFVDGPRNINQLLILIYRKTGEVRDRSQLAQKLYRMKRKGYIEPTSRKGEFRLPSIKEV